MAKRYTKYYRIFEMVDGVPVLSCESIKNLFSHFQDAEDILIYGHLDKLYSGEIPNDAEWVILPVFK